MLGPPSPPDSPRLSTASSQDEMAFFNRSSSPLTPTHESRLLTGEPDFDGAFDDPDDGEDLFWDEQENIQLIPLSTSQKRADLEKKVSFFNGLTLVVGLMIGSGIFASPGPVLLHAQSVGGSLLIWFISGLLGITGALCYVELGTALPMNGGEAVYLERAFGSLISFLFSFTAIIALKPGSAAIISVIFGEYVSRIILHAYFFDTPDDENTGAHPADDVIPDWLPKLLAIGCIVTISFINAFSVKLGTRVQDIFTALKLVAIVLITIMGIITLARGSTSESFSGDVFAGWNETPLSEYALGFYSGLWAYDGWNNLNYVSGEMQNPSRDLPRAIFWGLPLVIVCYLLANIAYLAVLPSALVMKTNTVALDFGKKVFGAGGGILFAVCVAMSCFGAANGTVFTSSRVVYVSARQGYIPSIFGTVSSKRHTPQAAIVLQCVLTIIFIIPGTFENLVNFYSVSAWIFYFLAILSLLVLRHTEPDLKRPYKTWLITPVLFCAIALFLVVMPFISKPIESLASVGFILIGIPVWAVRVWKKKALGQWFGKVTDGFSRKGLVGSKGEGWFGRRRGDYAPQDDLAMIES